MQKTKKEGVCGGEFRGQGMGENSKSSLKG